MLSLAGAQWVRCPAAICTEMASRAPEGGLVSGDACSARQPAALAGRVVIRDLLDPGVRWGVPGGVAIPVAATATR
jgi:hypothetical protein